MTDFFDTLEAREPEVREAEQFEALKLQIKHVKKNSSAYAKSLGDFLLEDIIDAKSFSQLPLTRKSDLVELQKSQPPFAGLHSNNFLVTHIFASPGPIYEPGYARADFWRLARSLHAAGFRAGDLVHNCFSYHLAPAGMMLESAALALGCRVIPAGVGQTELQVQTIADLKPQAYVGTPSFLKIILDKADELSIDISSITKAVVSGEALPASLRETFCKRNIKVLQAFASADLGLIAYESDAQQGLIIDEGVYLEIVKPGSGELIADGQVGELVVTSLSPEYPLIRFATGDLTAIMAGTSPCGRTNKRIQGWMGRADQTTKVRGMFIHPEQIDKVIKRHSEIAKARLVVKWVNQADQMTLHCETDKTDASQKAAIARSIQNVCKMRGEVKLVAVDSLANDGKVIDDIRQYD